MHDGQHGFDCAHLVEFGRVIVFFIHLVGIIETLAGGLWILQFVVLDVRPIDFIEPCVVHFIFLNENNVFSDGMRGGRSGHECSLKDHFTHPFLFPLETSRFVVMSIVQLVLDIERCDLHIIIESNRRPFLSNI